MPIIIEGGSRSAGWWWARHLQNTEKNERAELVAVAGLDSQSVPELFREMHALSLGTKCENYFYQANINPRADEHLTPAQWREAIETLGRNLGLEGQPYFVIEHEKEGRTHRHVVWSRIDSERMVAISDSLTAAIHERTSRELEIKFDLERGKSILVPDRDFERPERRAKKHERFRGAQNGVEPEAVAAELKALRERSDNGQSFRAAIEAAGYVLARGDRRDFVVVDAAGGDHSLARRLGMKTAELRQFMRDVDAKSLPSVEEARTRQQQHQAARDARQAQERTAKRDRPLNPTQGAIRAAWTLSHTGEQLTEALAARGIGLAVVTPEEARANQRARAFAKELGRFKQPLREGEIVAVNEHGHVYRFDPRKTGAERGEIAKRLAGIDAAGLLSVGDTKEAMRDASRMIAAGARRNAREQSRPVSRSEQAILDADKAAAGDPRNFAAELDKQGLAIARVTAADVAALDALRRDQDLARVVADAAGVAAEPQRLFAHVQDGEFAGVTRRGDVFRLNPHHLETVLSRLGETEIPAPTVTEARAGFELERHAAAVFQQEMIDIQLQRRADQAQERLAGEEAWDAGRDMREAGAAVDREVSDVSASAEEAVDTATHAGSRLLSGLTSLLAKALDFAADFISAPKPPPPDEAARTQRAAREARDQAAERRETDMRLQQTLDMTRTARTNAEREEAARRAHERQRERDQEQERDR